MLALAIALVGPALGTGSAETDPSGRQAVQQPAPPASSGVSEADEAQLKERVLARWQALIKRDFEAAYSFETPAYRAIYTPRQFMGQQGGQVGWRTAKVKEIRYDDPVVARVAVEITYRYAEPGEGGQVFDLNGNVSETWLRQDGQWWRQQD